MTIKPFKDRFTIKGELKGGTEAGTVFTPFDENEEPKEEEAEISPFIDKVRITKKIVSGTLSGSATTPISDLIVSRSILSTFDSGSDFSSVNHLRQGVEIINNFQRADRTLPVLGSGREDHTLDQVSFGVPPELKKTDGTIEPFAIRDVVFGTSTFEIEPHSIKSHLQDGNEDEVGRTSKVEQFISKNLEDEDKVKPYIDSTELFGSTNTGSIKIPGLISEDVELIEPFDETAFDTFLSSSVNGDFSGIILSMSLGRSGSQKDFGFVDHNKKSTTAGFVYDSVIKVGTDSLAFGDTQDYQRIGFLRELDSITGSIPTNARTGDRDRLGSFKIKFDDTRTITFEKDVFIDIQRNLQSGSIRLSPPFLSQTIRPDRKPIFYPFIGQKKIERATSSSLYTTGTVRKGIADSFVRFDDLGKEDITPFVEDADFSSKVDPFWTTGSKVEDVGLNFTAPLLSKTKVEIGLSPITSSFLIAVSGTSKYSMGYFNFKKKQFDGVGPGKTFISLPSTVADAELNLERAMFGFNVSNTDGVNVGFGGFQQGGFPISNFGFPVHAKYHATSSQLYHMSRSIQHPFLLEKIVYEFSGSFTSPESGGGHIATFFMLNQRSNFNIEREFNTETELGSQRLVLSTSLPEDVHLSAGGPSFRVDTIRDIISFNNVAIFEPDFTDSIFDAKKSELNIVAPDRSTSSDKRFVSGVFILSGTARSPSNNPNRMGVHKVGGASFSRYYMSNEFGGRNSLGLPTGRDFVNSVLGFNASGTFDVDSQDIQPNKTRFVNNPYIIFPEDKVVFGWQVPMPYTMAEADRTEMLIGPDKGKIILYGSLIKNQKEFHDTLNQSLTSNAVMETIGYDPVLDQLDTEYFQMFSGSYIDTFITGTMSNDPTKHRRVGGSALGQNGAESGSFFRNSQVCAENERFFDTLVPDPADITIANDKQVVGASINSITFGHYIESIGEDQNVYDNDWPRAFPFEPRYSSLRKTTKPFTFLLGTVDTAGTILDPPVLNKNNTLRQTIWNDTVVHSSVVGSGDFARGKIEDKIKHYYGIGDFVSGTVDYQFLNRTGATVMEGEGSIMRGWKYGLLNGLPQFPKLVFRRNRYGQLRDMLEQRVDGKFFLADGTTTSSPVQVFFKDNEPTLTFSSNLSHEATSSLPYFDGIVKNREDPLNADVG